MAETKRRIKAEENRIAKEEEEEEGKVEDNIYVRQPNKNIKLGEKHVQMTKYNSDSEAEVLLGWIRSLNTYFVYEETTECAKLNFATILLNGSAALWHQTREVRNYGTHMEIVQEMHQRAIFIA